MTETILSTKPKIFTSWPFTKKNKKEKGKKKCAEACPTTTKKVSQAKFLL